MRIVAAALVAALLGLAGVLKLFDPDAFALAIANYHMLPRQALQPAAYILPPLEIILAVALFLPTYRSAAWCLAGCLFAGFAGAVGSAVARGLDVSCGCFGGETTVSGYHLLGNVGLIAVCLWQWRFYHHQRPAGPAEATG